MKPDIGRELPRISSAKSKVPGNREGEFPRKKLNRENATGERDDLGGTGFQPVKRFRIKTTGWKPVPRLNSDALSSSKSSDEVVITDEKSNCRERRWPLAISRFV